jgi:hypothetical protein
LEFDTRTSLDRASASLSADFVRGLGIDLSRKAISAVVQRKLRFARHDIHVVRLEVVDGIYLPLCVYVPRRRGAPRGLVLSPLGCGSSCSSPEARALGTNLAERGMLVVVSEGFCTNGVRALLPDNDPRVGYARLLLGLRSEMAIYAQELVSALTWALEAHPLASPARVGTAGYSYGGGVAFLLAGLDRRVHSLSLPATQLGVPCDARPLPFGDLFVQDKNPEFVWSAPLEFGLPHRNSQIVMAYPAYLHTTAGSQDRGSPSDLMSGAMQYASKIYALAGLRDRLRFQGDDGDHHYGSTRREDTYDWLTKTMLRRPLERDERAFPDVPPEQLAVDIAGTRTLAEELMRRARAEREYRFLKGHPTTVARARARRAAVALFGERVEALTPQVVWSGGEAGSPIRASRYRADAYDVPVIELAGSGRAGSGLLFYVPQDGMDAELEALLRERARRFERVVAAEYLGIGELASDRVMLHTVARSLMYAEESLPRANIALLRGVLRQLGEGPIEVEGAGWAASLYARILGVLEPTRIRRVHVSGVPDDELAWLGAAGKVPDLLLHPALFTQLTAAELER